MNGYRKQMKKLGYEGCRNCKHQIAPLRGCLWLENGGDGVAGIICSRWEKRNEQKSKNY